MSSNPELAEFIKNLPVYDPESFSCYNDEPQTEPGKIRVRRSSRMMPLPRLTMVKDDYPSQRIVFDPLPIWSKLTREAARAETEASDSSASGRPVARRRRIRRSVPDETGTTDVGRTSVAHRAALRNDGTRIAGPQLRDDNQTPSDE